MKKDGIMKHLFNPQIRKVLWVLLILLLVIKLIWFLVEVLWLPTSGMEHAEEKNAKALYYRVKLSPNKAPAPASTVKTKPAKVVGSIKDITLLAIYNASDVTVITVVYKKKTKVLSRGDKINGFTLEGAGSNFATFSKMSKTYRVELFKSKKGAKSTSSIKKVPAASPSKPVAAAKKAVGEVVDAGDHKIIDKSLFDYYANNMDDIYKNIGISEVKEGKDLKGFRISFVRKGSPFAKLGLKRNDMIKSVNGEEINSYNAAFNMYKNIKDIKNLTLTIIRGKEEMELEYEIN